MDEFIALLQNYGSLGMFISAFLSGSILPFSSEVVMLGLLNAGANPWGLLIWGTLGNTLGTMLNYGIGRLGREEWINRITQTPPEKLEKGKRWVHQYGAWAGLLAWLPVIGELISVAMGYLRIPLVYSVVSITIGKLVRYWIIVQTFLSV